MAITVLTFPRAKRSLGGYRSQRTHCLVLPGNSSLQVKLDYIEYQRKPGSGEKICA